MEALLRDIESMGGLEKSFVYKDRAIITTTFSHNLEESLAKAGKIISQLYISMGINNLPYGEIYFEMNDIQLICYSIEKDFFIAFVGNLGINISLTRMTVQSYISQIKELSKNPKKSASKPETHEEPSHTALSNECEGAISKIGDYLLSILGPIAPILLNEAVNKWKKGTSNLSVSNLIELVKITSDQISDSHAKKKFLEEMGIFLKTLKK